MPVKPLILLAVCLLTLQTLTRSAQAEGITPAVTAKSPGELLSALTAHQKPDWASRFRPPMPATFSSRAQNALTLGSVFADVQLAVHAEDIQQSKNLSRDIVTLAKPLGIQNEMADKSKSLAELAEKKDWPALKLELERTQAELESTLLKHGDADLMMLVTLGAWMRSTEIVASLVGEKYTEDAASLLRQPALAQLLREKIYTLSEKIQADPTVVRIRTRLKELEDLLSNPASPFPSQEEVRLLSETIASVLWDITTKATGAR